MDAGRMTARTGSPHQRASSSGSSGRSAVSCSATPRLGTCSHRHRSRFQLPHAPLPLDGSSSKPGAASAPSSSAGGAVAAWSPLDGWVSGTRTQMWTWGAVSSAWMMQRA
eukprot:scaffold5910_cov103-Isochrysis_galbana.AAC.3